MNIKFLPVAITAVFLSSCGEASYEDQMKGCKTVHPQHIQNILDGVQNSADMGKFKLKNVYAFRSNDREKIHFVSGELIYSPTNTSYDLGTWVLNNIDSTPSIYWAMPGAATEQTVYPDATQNKAQLSVLDHGYVQSRQCSRVGTR